MLHIILKLFAVFIIFFTAGFTFAAEKRKKTVILVSIDGMRWDYLKLHQPKHLMSLQKTGLSTERLIPIFPSKTFPNHYSIVTGLYAENHGIISNRFYDPDFNETYSLGNNKAVANGKWYGGEPIWVTARRQGVRSACFFWPGSEAEIKGMRPNIYKKYDERVSGAARVAQVLEWLRSDNRPGFISLYFSDVDSKGHKYGPRSMETKKAVQKVDSLLFDLSRGINRIGLEGVVDLVIVSDHGMADSNRKNSIEVSSLLKKPFIDRSIFSSTMLMIWSKDVKKMAELFKTTRNFDLIARQDIPARYRFKNNKRIPPYIAVPHQGWVFSNSDLDNRIARGTHGYDNTQKDMSGVFIGHGPSFGAQKIKPFENIEVYTMIAHILGINPAKNDGKDLLIPYIKP